MARTIASCWASLQAEQRPARAGEVHEGQHHLGHAREVGGPGGTLQDGGDRAGVDAHGRLAMGVHDLGRGGEDDEPPDGERVMRVLPARGAQDGRQALDVGLQGARVGLQVLPRGELERVDEDGDDDGAARPDPTGGLGHEVEVALVERPHGHDNGAGHATGPVGPVVNGEGGGELVAAAGQGHPAVAGCGGDGRVGCGRNGERHGPHAR